MARTLGDVGLDADDWLDAAHLGFFVELHCAVEHSVVGKADGLLAQFHRTVHELWYA